jgi:hypothetical protein
MTALLLLVGILDNPFNEGVAGLGPTAMERTRPRTNEALAAAGVKTASLPCDALGRKA